MFYRTTFYVPKRAKKASAKQTMLYADIPISGVLNGRLGGYDVQMKLGEGGFGSVYLAETTLDGERAPVAIKVVRRSNLTRGSDLASLLEEQAHHRFFTTENGAGYFPQLIESFSDAHNYYFVSEYICGGTLRDEMMRNGGKLEAGRAKLIMAQCLTIVEHMHERGVMHRDIKPENILIDAVGNVVFADFGLARRFRSLKRTEDGDFLHGPIRMSHSKCGTVGYQAPEMIFGIPYAYQTDVYSLGCMFYEMITGHVPFPRTGPRELAHALKNCSPSFPEQAESMDLFNLLSWLLMVNAEQRIPTWAAKQHPYFDDVDWDRMAERSYTLYPEWAPPAPWVDEDFTIDKDFLIDRTTALRDRIYSPFDIHFAMPRRTPTIRRPVPVLYTLNEFDVGRLVVNSLDKARERYATAQANPFNEDDSATMDSFALASLPPQAAEPCTSDRDTPVSPGRSECGVETPVPAQAGCSMSGVDVFSVQEAADRCDTSPFAPDHPSSPDSDKQDRLCPPPQTPADSLAASRFGTSFSTLPSSLMPLTPVTGRSKVQDDDPGRKEEGSPCAAQQVIRNRSLGDWPQVVVSTE
ncbi:hypothetical protein M0805_000171 [Coniferiporia weirii]|nr:hypothetical protein M0805_000171 [Coniferiporia weirii]